MCLLTMRKTDDAVHFRNNVVTSWRKTANSVINAIDFSSTLTKFPSAFAKTQRNFRTFHGFLHNLFNNTIPFTNVERGVAPEGHIINDLLMTS